MSDKTFTEHKPEYEWFGRSLDNYKKLHAGTARNKGVYEQFMASKTLTQARKVCFGMKRGNSK